MKARWIVAAIAVSALAIGAIVWVSHRGDSPSTGRRMPIGSAQDKGDPRAQCKVLALGALEALAQDDTSVLDALAAGHDPSTRFIAGVVRSNQAAFLASAKRGTPAAARRELTPKISTDCANAP